MRWKLFVVVLSVALCVSVGAYAAPAKPDLNDVAGLFSTLHSGKSVEPVRVTRTETGFIRSVGAPPGGYLENTGAKGLNEEGAAKAFLSSYSGAIANKSAKLGFGSARVSKSGSQSFVKFGQTYAGLPVFGAGISIQLDDTSNVAFFLSHIMTDTQLLDTGQVPTAPKITATQAKQYAIDFLTGANPGQSFTATSSPILTVYDPTVVGNSGAEVLAWQLNVSNGVDEAPVAETVLVNAVNGSVALHYSIIYDALNRQIFDAKSTAADPGVLVRSEGGAASALTDVNQAYEFYGDTYEFYFNNFGRDSIDNKGLTLSATVRYCPDTADCPFRNAYWDPDKLRMYFGVKFTAEEDVVAHELTHGVTSHESNLIYVNQSGAINESLSDVFGKCVALSYHDAGLPSYLRWLIGFNTPSGTFRDMSDPPSMTDYFPDAVPYPLPMPDRLGSPYYYTGGYDNGGVHHNSGVNNKLCFLLVDGQFFNGSTVTGMGITKVAQLYYEAQVHLLVPSSNYTDLYAALSQAALNIGATAAERQNIETAMCAVEISPDSLPLRNFRAQSQGTNGVVALTWKNASCASSNVVLIRKAGGFPTSQTDGTPVYSGQADSYIDTPPANGTEYYYALDIPAGNHVFSSGALFARVVTGSPVPSSFTENFDQGSFDLGFTQILYSPSFDSGAAALSGKPASYVNYGDYTATVTKGISGLPTARTTATRLFLLDDGHVKVNLSTPFPYFGAQYDSIFINSNGFISFQAASSVYTGSSSNSEPETATLSSHFNIPQISFLFSELSPRTGGEAWYQAMSDRVVVTFDKIPEYGYTKGNTIQTELFFSGHIRVTYTDINAVTAVCGLSDGRGIPPNPLTFKNNVANLSELGTSTRLALDPIGVLSATAGDVITFTAVATGGTPIAAPITYSATSLPSGATINATTGVFRWPTTLTQQGQYNVVVKATKGFDVVAQNVTIYVADPASVPVASNLTITPLKPQVINKLEGSYTYTHPTGVPEGASIIAWYRNGNAVPVLSGLLEVPTDYLLGGETWSFSVIPVAANGAQGVQVFSSGVRVRKAIEADVDGDGLTDAVDIQLVINAALGIDITPYDADVNGDGTVDSIDIQLVINAAAS